MKQLVALILAVGVASADIGLTYKVPETSYGVPAYQQSNVEYNSGYIGANGYNYNAESSAQVGYQGSSFGQQNLDYQSGYQTASALGADSGSAGYQTSNYKNNFGTGSQYYQHGGLNSGYNTVSQPSYQVGGAAAQGGYQTFNQQQTSSQYQSSVAAQKYQQFYNQWQQQPAQVFKHFYVHAAPEEPEPERHRSVVLPPPQKHYKIIFIKAPSQTVYQPQYIPVPQPNEEKTIVYVLVKKPEEQQDFEIPKLEQKPPAKPEVFFIKYNNKDDSSAVINNIVSDYNKVDTVNFASGSGTAVHGTGQYNTGSGHYQTGTGYYNQGISGQSSQGTSGQGTYNQYAQKESGNQASSGFGSSSQAVSTADSSVATATAGYTTGVTGTSATSLGALSTSQGVPHETYGPPKFKV